MGAAVRDAVPPPRLVLATTNAGKVAELRRLPALLGWRVVSLDDVGFGQELLEPGPGYLENALAKAAAVERATGLHALADDSGIEVDALRGWPGPASARWLGELATDRQRLLGLLDEVRRHCPDEPQVRYVCVAALARPGAEPVAARGECLGELVEPRGERGFGYDPGFLSSDLGTTFGEASDADKDRVSHRARAVRRLAEAGVLDTSLAQPQRW
ncbi:MAG: non-canonical purine NTP pyrophosphatase [Chloroflexi bacterium]|nr:MAG: non-canonical purine NTP pyrophosphatase [Chloroflexota bacterium]